MDIRSVESVCLALGPYRNLTTLTASALFLHPQCQVLNHGGERIFGHREFDFLHGYHKKKLDRFIQFGIQISKKGQRGDQGGSIMYSHAFGSEHGVRDIFSQTGLGLTKKIIKCLFWKESLLTSNMIRERQTDLASIFAKEDRLRFLLPIRNPMDCALSNLNTGHVNRFQDLDENASATETVQSVLDQIFWVAYLKSKYPDRFFYFTELEISRTICADLARFLCLDADDHWMSNVIAAMKIKRGYEHEEPLVDFYRDYIGRRASQFPELSERLLAFC